MIQGQATGGNDTVNALEFLVQGMEDAEEADLGSQVPRVAATWSRVSALARISGTVDGGLILKSQWRQRVGKGEKHVRITGGQQIAAARLDPAVARLDLAARAMPVAAR